MRMPTRLVTAVSLVAALVVAAGCSSAGDGPQDGADAADKTSIRIGFTPGPYADMFTGGILPILAADGYEVDNVEFTDGIVVNVALGDGEIDANIMQHQAYLDAISAQEGLDNVALVQVSTPPMALFGGKKSSLDDVTDGSTVAVPNQPSNMYRAFKVLEQVGWIELSETVDPATASVADVTVNPHNLEFVAMENAQQVAALPDVDYDVIQGNFVVSGGLRLTDALELEELTDEFAVVVAVDAANADSDWAEDIREAYESDEFADYIAGDPQYAGYRLPDALVD